MSVSDNKSQYTLDLRQSNQSVLSKKVQFARDIFGTSVEFKENMNVIRVMKDLNCSYEMARKKLEEAAKASKMSVESHQHHSPNKS